MRYYIIARRYYLAGLLALFSASAMAIDYTDTVTAIQGVSTTAATVMLAIIGVVAGFWGFKKVLALLGR